MLFYILLFLGVLPAILSLLYLFKSDGFHDFDVWCYHTFFASLLTVFPLFTWYGHAQELSIIAYQDLVINDYEERIVSLNSRLQTFDYPKSALLNSDTPVASIVKSISEAENGLLDAKTERSKAILSVEKTRNGPMSGVISFVGDYKKGGE
jgi:hypothetical protein